jgi:hypothetical protein
MTRGKKPVERRKHKRFQVRKDAFAMVTPLSNKSGEIIDISKGGLALRYIPGEEQSRASSEIDVFLHIFLKDISFCLLRVPIRTVSDLEMGDESSSNAPRRRSVRFGALSESQASELDYFIQNHALG